MDKIKIGSQLYTYRNLLKTAEDIDAVFGRIASYGCTVAQWSGVKVAIDPKEVKRIGDEHGIEVALSHTPFDRIVGDTDRVAEEHLLMGAHTVGLGMMASEYSSSYDKLMEFIDIVNEVSIKLKPYGLKFGYHNHAKEFKKMGDKLIIEHLRDGSDMEFIFDTFWCRYAGHNPSEWLENLSGRVTDIHLKDWKWAPFKLPRFQDIGKGKLDFVDILSSAEKAGTKYAYIEHDLTSDPDKTTRESMEYLQEIYYNK
ncbi:MAG: sugar phosphate isomerase/epimerase [Clostridia bacterium]|nr:sugar phosphate isomerase/epimerase [Clostridia bacterium]